MHGTCDGCCVRALKLCFCSKSGRNLKRTIAEKTKFKARSGWSNIHVFSCDGYLIFPSRQNVHLVFPNFSKPRNETRQKQWKKTTLVVIKHGLLENHQFTFIWMISDAIPSYKPADDLLLTATSLPKLWPSRYQDSSGWLRMRRPKLSLGKLPATFSAPIDPAAGIKGRLPTQQLSWT